MSRSPRVLVIYKRSTYQRYRGGQSARISELLRAGDLSVEHMLKEHEAHLDTRERARKALRSLQADAVFHHRYEPEGDDEWDLVITLGGDGTLLWTSHLLGADTPVVAINSAPEISVGYFCAGDRHRVFETIRAALEGELKRTRLHRMQVEIDGELVTTRVLNDILFCHECPAATTRYILRLDRESVAGAGEGEQEEQMSSGIWVGPAAGSTAAQRSAGGKVLPVGSRRLQFVVREPYSGVQSAYGMRRGMVPPTGELRILSKIREGRIFMDGAQKIRSVDIGSEIRLTTSPEPLTILGLSR